MTTSRSQARADRRRLRQRTVQRERPQRQHLDPARPVRAKAGSANRRARRGKQAKDDAKIAELAASGVKPIRLVYQDGGQHPRSRAVAEVSRPEALAPPTEIVLETARRAPRARPRRDLQRPRFPRPKSRAQPGGETAVAADARAPRPRDDQGLRSGERARARGQVHQRLAWPAQGARNPRPPRGGRGAAAPEAAKTGNKSTAKIPSTGQPRLLRQGGKTSRGRGEGRGQKSDDRSAG